MYIGIFIVAKLLKDKISAITDQIIITNQSYKNCLPIILRYLVCSERKEFKLDKNIVTAMFKFAL